MGGILPKLHQIEISESLDEMYRIRKHYLILSDAGKPVYSRYGDLNNLSPFIATISAILPKIQSYFWDSNQDARHNENKVHTIGSRMFKVYFLRKAALIYICMVSLHERCALGGYFLDDIPFLPQFSTSSQK